MKYCSNCAGPLSVAVPDDDNLPRHICDGCGTIHYLNPKIVTGCLPVYEDKVLLCKRAIEPRLGYWTLPAGYMENAESTTEGALRETREEANAEVTISHLYTLTSIVHVNQVQMLYLAELDKPEFSASSESLEVRLFREDEIPWDELAFTTIRNALQFYFEDRQKGTFPLREVILRGN
ncbi:NUDIX hydrolase [Neptuniibacter halophilus]|uniref:NUDIX hydrolase n=1 Tax=Neptuniibacter halophilus TaxID=651666 RepID=UPI0025726793|nr:NUDIX hydrolase [Neptuniibacter halophilus]